MQRFGFGPNDVWAGAALGSRLTVSAWCLHTLSPTAARKPIRIYVH
jgi:hypothetical protein